MIISHMKENLSSFQTYFPKHICFINSTRYAAKERKSVSWLYWLKGSEQDITFQNL